MTERPCTFLAVESAKNKLFRGLIYLFTTILIGLAGYGVHLNYNTSRDVAKLQESMVFIKQYIYAFDSSKVVHLAQENTQ